jgi:hypothetical protein
MRRTQNPNKYCELENACISSDPFESPFKTLLIWDMRRQKRRRDPARVVMVELRDFELFSERSGVTVTIHARELMERFKALAEHNGFTVGQLLQNSEIPANKPLQCCIMQHLPNKSDWMHDAGGYIIAKLHRNRTVVGHTFLGDGSTDAQEYEHREHATSGFGKHGRSNGTNPSPPRAKRKPPGMPKRFDDYTLSPGSPGQEQGCTQPLLIRIHRAAALATSVDPAADSKLLVRHICENTRCGVVNHFRPGSQRENDDEKEYHRLNQGCSREHFPKRE